MTESDMSNPAAGEQPPARWSQPPEGSAAPGNWSQPPAAGPRRPVGSTQAEHWVGDPAAAGDQQQPQPQPPVSSNLEPDAEATAEQAAAAAAMSRVFMPEVRTCPKCGGDIDWDGYCMQCGAKAPSARDHLEEHPASWVGGVCDRGMRHPRNEDAMALQAGLEPGGKAVLAVCDGVSMSTDSDRASLAAAHAVLGYIGSRIDWDWNLLDLTPAGSARQMLDQTARIANEAVLANSNLDEASPASCTLALALVNGPQILSATLGDSRVYWIPDAGEAGLLSTDDSMAQEQIAAGVERSIAESGMHSHVITRWLGRDAPDVRPTLASMVVDGPGWLLVCSDGLWNYASDPVALAQVVQQVADEQPESGPLTLAQKLVDWANQQGGEDNITAALARIEAPAEPDPEIMDDQAADLDTPTTRLHPNAG